MQTLLMFGAIFEPGPGGAHQSLEWHLILAPVQLKHGPKHQTEALTLSLSLSLSLSLYWLLVINFLIKSSYYNPLYDNSQSYSNVLFKQVI